MWFLLLVSLLAQAPSALAADERAILTVVVEELGDVAAQTMAHDDVAEAINVARSLPPHTRIDTGEEVSWLSRELLDSLRTRNLQPSSLSSTATRSTTAVVVVSRPGVSKDGKKALVVIEHTDAGGHPDRGGFMYLEKRGGEWMVAALGPGWEY